MPIEEYDEEKTLKLTKVDKDHLDTEWVYCGRKIYEYGLHLSNAIDNVSYVKNQMELKKAEIASGVRSDPSEYDLPKATESAINEVVIANDEYQVFTTDLRAAEKLVGDLKAAISGLHKKQDGLLWTTKLFMMNYYADKIPEEAKGFIDDQQDRTEAHEEYQRKLKINREG